MLKPLEALLPGEVVGTTDKQTHGNCNLNKTNKAKAISVDLLVFIKLGSCNILVLGTFKFW